MLNALIGTSLVWTVALLLAALAPPAAVTVRDNPNDGGGAILVSWSAPEAESLAPTGWQVLRSTAPDSGFTVVTEEPAQSLEFLDAGTRDGTPYYYQVIALYETGPAAAAVAGPVLSRPQWFRTPQLNVLVVLVVICVVFAVYLGQARRGRKMFIRKIAGLDAIDDALGRATEMGKPILFSFGLGVLTDMVVMAALPLLRRIAGRSARYSTRLLVPNADPLVMTAAQETVKEAYTEAGRPDLYNADNVSFVTSDQFGYAAGVDGMLLRERPGAVFWIGSFYAESLIMAETGHSVGAIQLAGTIDTAQLPFFVAACDYTMIGEEVFAASCYLKPEPMMLGSIKGEDFLKMWLIVITLAVVALATVTEALNIAALRPVVALVTGWFTPAY